jgi:hypothetical protein
MLRENAGMANIGEPVREGEWPEFDPSDLPPPVQEPAAPAPEPATPG